ncbi:MAG: hypothetical protein ERJ68_02575 [Aphanocapsa feldmannii 277cI]|uniref:Uncharacterized protein n=1 Tax=Aphanocapsa feldmannii 277cI TaxID=2507554 RepID=A0A524RVH5_9CHRO|nr:MAG: hypothetical protein ERJ68_02575 [Aphanocapsa feldmannii 277cI]
MSRFYLPPHEQSSPFNLVHLDYDVDIHAAIEDDIQPFLSIGAERLEWAIADSMVKAAVAAQKYGRRYLKRRIDRPTPFTLRSLTIRPRYINPKRHKLAVQVGYKEDERQRKQHYLSPLVRGGPRHAKPSEGTRRLGMFMTPIWEGIAGAPGLRPDAYGNVKGGGIVKVLSALRRLSNLADGFDGNRSYRRRSQAKRRREDYFLSSTPSGSPRIYARVRHPDAKRRAKRRRSGRRAAGTSLKPLKRGIKPVFAVHRQAPRYRRILLLPERLHEAYIRAVRPNLINRLRKEMERLQREGQPS